MGWTCSTCGFDGNADGVADCQGGCGAHRKSMLRFEFVGGKQTIVRVPTSFNRRLLQVLGGDDARFASDPQFEVHPGDSGGWLLRHCPSARNATWVNGTPVGPDGVDLRTGDLVSIGAEKLRASASLQYE